MRPRRGSSLVARLLTVVYALVVTPIATGLIAYGGSAWLRYSMSMGTEASLAGALGTPLGMQIVLGLGGGVLLLASVVATGLASSAGLVAVGLLGLVPIVLSVVPALLFEVYENASGIIPFSVLDGLVYGLPLVLHPLLGGFGLALVLGRRRPDAHLVAAIAGLLLLPLTVLLGTVLLLAGLGHGAAHAMQTFDLQPVPLAIVLVLAGALLVWLSGAASSWSPYALAAPALLLLLATVAALSPATVGVPGLWSSRTGGSVMAFLVIGGGIAAAAVLLVHTAVLAVVRGRARRRAAALAL